MEISRLKRTSLWIAFSLALFTGPVSAQIDSAFDDAFTQKLVSKLHGSVPDMPIQSLFKTPVAGLVGVELEGGQIMYVSDDGQFLLNGDLYTLAGPVTNLSENRRADRRKAVLDAVPVEEMVVFSPAGETKDYITVFTDVDCGYCRKLHQEMPQINALGIEVRYLAYPRMGLNTPTYSKIVSAWCADNKQEAMTALKAGRDIPAATCANPVAKQFQIGQQVGVNGTPAIVTSSGLLLPGYRPAAELAAAVGL